ncbi:MAG: DNA polymerase Y family protein [Rhodospirillaceae bacterium]|nr:DNA polymerase Y family protein [Rhodospirillaceae bacterium]
MRRAISVWLPYWPIDRLRRAQRSAAPPSRAPPAEPIPFALTAPGRHGTVLTAVNRQARAEGLAPGMRLADARALLPRLAAAEARPEEDRRALARLALWCNRFTPCCAVDSGDGPRGAEGGAKGGAENGLLLDIAGCAHLFGGEAAMAAAVEARLADLSIEAQTGLADTPAAAWALARFGRDGRRRAAPGATLAALAPLPVEALRIAPGDARLLRRLGLTTIGAAAALPRAALARRFRGREGGQEGSGTVLQRLDRALGRRPDPVASLPPPPACLARLAFAEPLVDLAGLEAALARLADDLCAALERAGLGARELTLLFCRVDGAAAARRVSTARATRDAAHLARLFAGKIETVDPGFGIDAMALHAVRAEPLSPAQFRLAEGGRGGGDPGPLIDRLQARLGAVSVFRLEPVESHLPERAERRAEPGPEGNPWPARPGLPQRPFRLFDRPEPVEAVAEVPDGPPVLFVWRRLRRRIARAEGPERIEPEWWAQWQTGDPEGAPRDYYRVEDAEGRRYWLFRAGLYRDGLCRDAGGRGTPRWYIHGLYG